MGAMVAEAAIKGVNGDLSDKQAFLARHPGREHRRSGRSRSASTNKHQAILNQYVVKVEKDSNGDLYHKVYETFEGVEPVLDAADELSHGLRSSHRPSTVSRLGHCSS